MITSEPLKSPLTTAPLTLTLFGPMQVLVEGRPLPRLRSRKVLWMLALLVLRAGRPVEREWLAGTLWPDVDPSRASANLRVALSELRRVLGNQAGRLQTPGRHTLSLNLHGADVDVRLFDEAVVRRDQAALEQAAALYQGPLLEGCLEEWVGQERGVREQNCLEALQSLADAALLTGDTEAAASYCRRAVLLDPWREAAQRGLMQALSRKGDGNAALDVYQVFVRFLRKDDPRAAPDAETAALYARLRAEARRRASAPPPLAAAAAPAAVRGYLPHPLTDLVGREDEREDVAALLRRSRLVTLTGPGGIGKTRLAIAVANEAAPGFADGVWLVALEALSDGGHIARQTAGVLGLREEAGRMPLEGLTAYLAQKRLLLVLDNCEHLLDDSAHLAAHLLRACAGLCILTTSREPLLVTGEAAWAVPALSVPDTAQLPAEPTTLVRVLAGYDGVRLFVERAQGVQKTFALTRENARSVAHICTRLEGVPLAIELAAARIRSLTIGQIASRLDDHLALLTGGNRTAQQRQRTLRATLDWSYHLLGDPERLLLGRMSVFVGGWSLEAAERVGEGDGILEGQVLDLLTSLIDKSLIVYREASGSGRYRLLETVRQYAREKLETGAEANQVQARHRDFFMSLAEEAEPHLVGSAQASWLIRLEAERDNLRAALVWCGTEVQEAKKVSSAERNASAGKKGLRLAAALWQFWELHGYYREGRAFLTETLERDYAQSPTNARAKALNAAGVLAFYQGDYLVAQALHEESLTISRETGDQPGIAWSLKDLGKLSGVQGDSRRAKRLYEESLTISRALMDGHACAEALNDLGSLALERGEYVAAQALHEESLEINRRLADQQASAWSLLHLGGIANTVRDYGAAATLYEESVAIFREHANKQGIAWAVSGLGKAAFEQADYARAQALQEEGLINFRDLGNKHGIAWSLDNLGVTALREGKLQSARDLFGESLPLFRELGNKTNTARSLSHLGSVAFHLSEVKAARDLFKESLSIFQGLEDKEWAAETLHDLGAVCLSHSEWEKGARLYGAAQAWRERLQVLLPQPDQKNQDQTRRDLMEYDKKASQARSALGEHCFAAAWEEGRAMSREQAVEYALNK